jgi:glutamine kinase
LNLLSGTDNERKNFLRTYGHLRPGTYDILSPCYRELTKKELYNHSESISPTKTNSFSLNQRQKNKINKLLSEENCNNFSADQLIDYIKMAITSREYGKFVFTRSVSAILDNIATWGKSIGATRESLSHVSIADIQYAQQEEQNDDSCKALDHLNNIANENRERWTHARSIRLPQILEDCEGVDVVPFQVSQPNFITNKKATGEVVFLNSGFSSQNISGKVILIENADPGFDWIFSQGIQALITKYGGANSHMAIRCAEFDIPAAIGCGEQRFELLSKGKRISLDCSSRIVSPIF